MPKSQQPRLLPKQLSRINLMNVCIFLHLLYHLYYDRFGLSLSFNRARNRAFALFFYNQNHAQGNVIKEIGAGMNRRRDDSDLSG